MFAPSLDHPVNNRYFYFAKTEIKLDFKCVFLYMCSFIKKLLSKFYGFVIDKLSTMTKP